MTYWRMAMRFGSGGTDVFDDCRERGIAAADYWVDYESDERVVTDCRKLTREQFKARWRRFAPTNISMRTSIGHLAYDMKIGDVIYAKKGPYIVGKGTVVGEYAYDPKILAGTAARFAHFVKVRWQRGYQAFRCPLHPYPPTLLKLDTERVQKIREGEVAIRLWGEAADTRALWVYKCNRKSAVGGDWHDVFKQTAVVRWGGSSVTNNPVSIRILNEHIKPDDLILAYQTDDRLLVGICRVSRITGNAGDKVIYLKPVHEFSKPIPIHEVRQRRKDVHRIKAFAPGFAQTLYAVSPAERRIIESVCHEAEVTIQGFEEELLRPEDAVLPNGDDIEDVYNPRDIDRRQLVQRQIRERRGQQSFRNSLCKRYGNRCLVTGCKTLDVLEAAHICHYRSDDDNNPANGLLLRADIHTLFDLDLLGVEPDRLQVKLHPDVAREYGPIVGRSLMCAKVRPSREALQKRYDRFCKRLAMPMGRR